MIETYKEYFDYCKDQYQGEFYGELPLEDLTVKKYSKGDPSFKWPEDYQSKIKNIHDYCKLKIEKREGLFDPEHQNIIKVDDYYGCPEVTELGNFFSEYLEKNTYNCYSGDFGTVTLKPTVRMQNGKIGEPDYVRNKFELTTEIKFK